MTSSLRCLAPVVILTLCVVATDGEAQVSACIADDGSLDAHVEALQLATTEPDSMTATRLNLPYHTAITPEVVQADSLCATAVAAYNAELLPEEADRALDRVLLFRLTPLRYAYVVRTARGVTNYHIADTNFVELSVLVAPL